MKSLYDKMSIAPYPPAKTIFTTAIIPVAVLARKMRFSSGLFPSSASLIYRKNCRTSLWVEDGVRSSSQEGAMHD